MPFRNSLFEAYITETFVVFYRKKIVNKKTKYVLLAES